MRLRARSWPWLAVLLCGALALPLGAQEGPRTLRVGAGDSATAIAQQIKPAEATLEQTLLALWRANPQAFVNGNLNLLREGASLRVPSRAEMLQTPPDEARAAMVAQVAHVTAFARQLALAQEGKLPPASVAAPAKQPAQPPSSPATAPPTAASPAPSAPPDAATLARALQEAQALQKALEKQNQDVQAQLQQLSQSIAALQRMSAPVATPEPAALAPVASASAESATAVASGPAGLASTAAAAPHETAPTPVALPAQPPEPLWWAAGLLLGLAVVALWVRWRRRSAAPAPVADIPPAMARIDLNLDAPPVGPDTRP